MADTELTVNLYKLNDGVQGILDYPFAHKPGAPLAKALWLRAGPLLWAYKHAAMYPDKCWCSRPCKQYFAVFLRRVTLTVTTYKVTFKSFTTSAVYYYQSTNEPAFSVIDPANRTLTNAIKKGDHLFKLKSGQYDPLHIAPEIGHFDKIEQIPGAYLRRYVPFKVLYLGYGSFGSNVVTPEWKTPFCILSLSNLRTNSYGTISSASPPQEIIQAGINKLSIDNNVIQYPADAQPLFLMRICTNYNVGTATKCFACDYKTTGSTGDFEVYPALPKDTTGVSYHRLVLKESPLNPFNNLYLGFIKGTAQVATMPLNMLRPYDVYYSGSYFLGAPLPGFILEDSVTGVTAGRSVLDSDYSKWVCKSNQIINSWGQDYDYSKLKKAVLDNPFSTVTSLAVDTELSDYYRCTSPYIVHDPANIPSFEEQLKILNNVSSNDWPLTDYAVTVCDLPRHCPDNLSSGVMCSQIKIPYVKCTIPPETTLPTIQFTIFKKDLTPSLDSTGIVSYDPAQVAWVIANQGISLKLLINTHYSLLGFKITDNGHLYPDISYSCAVGYIEPLASGYTPSNPATISYQSGVIISFAYPDCAKSTNTTKSPIAQGLGLLNNIGMYKRGAIPASITANTWYLLKGLSLICPSDLSTFKAYPTANITISNLSVLSDVCFVQMTPVQMWTPGALSTTPITPFPETLINVKKYTIDVYNNIGYNGEFLKDSYTVDDLTLTQYVTASTKQNFFKDNSGSVVNLATKTCTADSYYYLESEYCDLLIVNKLYDALGTETDTAQKEQDLGCSTDESTKVSVNTFKITREYLRLLLITIGDYSCKAFLKYYIEGTTTANSKGLRTVTAKTNGGLRLVTCSQLVAKLASSCEGLAILTALLQKYILNDTQPWSFKLPERPCPDCLLKPTSTKNLYFKVTIDNDRCTAQQILSLDLFPSNESEGGCTDNLDGTTTAYVSQNKEFTKVYKISLSYLLDVYGVVLYTCYKRCRLTSTTITNSSCQIQLQHTNSECLFFIKAMGYCFDTIDLAKACLYFKLSIPLSLYPDYPLAQYPCGTNCDLPSQKDWYMSVIQARPEAIYDEIREQQQSIKGLHLSLLQLDWTPPVARLPYYSGCQGFQVTVKSNIIVAYVVGAAVDQENGCNIYATDITLYANAASDLDAARIMKAEDLVPVVKNLVAGIKSSGTCSQLSQIDCDQLEGTTKVCYYKNIGSGGAVANIASIPQRVSTGWGYLNGADNLCICNGILEDGSCMDYSTYYWEKRDILLSQYELPGLGKFTFYGTGYFMHNVRNFAGTSSVEGFTFPAFSADVTNLFDRAVYVKFLPTNQDYDCTSLTSMNSYTNLGTAWARYLFSVTTFFADAVSNPDYYLTEVPSGFPCGLSKVSTASLYSAAASNLDLGE